MNAIVKLRFEKFIKNFDESKVSGAVKFVISTQYFSDLYNEYDELKTDPKEHFERYFLSFLRYYNNVLLKNEGKEFVENSHNLK